MHLKIDVGLVFITATKYSRKDSEHVLETASEFEKTDQLKRAAFVVFLNAFINECVDEY